MTEKKNTTARVRRTTDFLFGNWASRIYLLTVLAAAVFLAWDMLFVDHVDASFSGVYLIGLTSPGSWIGFPLVDAGPQWLTTAGVLGGTVLGALLNTALISGIVHFGRELLASLRTRRA
jgi:hypothetical protein